MENLESKAGPKEQKGAASTYFTGFNMLRRSSLKPEIETDEEEEAAAAPDDEEEVDVAGVGVASRLNVCFKEMAAPISALS